MEVGLLLQSTAIAAPLVVLCVHCRDCAFLLFTSRLPVGGGDRQWVRVGGAQAQGCNWWVTVRGHGGFGCGLLQPHRLGRKRLPSNYGCKMQGERVQFASKGKALSW